MVVNLKLCRFEDAPWGFRLIGGSDFEVPLTVVKVTEGSIAEKAGMRVGDVIVRINDTPACDLTHNDAHKVILHCGNNFFLGVMRENEEEGDPGNTFECHNTTFEPIDKPDKFPIKENCTKPGELFPAENTRQDEKVTDDEIADIMSGEAEVLKEHNVIGYTSSTQAGICQSSEVFRTLNEEAVKTDAEKEKDKRKWTTFLQKPNRPIPKSRKEIEEEAKREKYRVKIVKQPKPRVAPDHVPSPTPSPEIVNEFVPEVQNTSPFQPVLEGKRYQNEETPATENDHNVENEDVAPIERSEPPNLQDAQTSVDDTGNAMRVDDTGNVASVDSIEIEQKHEEVEKTNESSVKNEEELLLQKQLADVQQQLLILSSLPSTIQATLDAVTKQLAELLPAFHLQSSSICKEASELEDTKEEPSVLTTEEAELPPSLKEEVETDQTNASVLLEESDDMQTIEIMKSAQYDEHQAFSEMEATCDETLDEKNEVKRKKEQLEDEHQQRLIRERTPKRPPRSFGPLTPQERPLILPGGRRWRKPKDAYNDEFIAEILSSQAELIVGTTLGSTYESPLLGYDDRVNFLKYQKPEKHIDLEKSEVYKVVHNLERKPKRGIETRPEKVIAEADVRSRVTPMPSG